MDLQRGFWTLLGVSCSALGAVYLLGRQGVLMRTLRTLGPALSRGAAALGVLFGLNILACAVPLSAALLAGSLGAGEAVGGLMATSVFGLALSLPLVAVVFWSRGRRWLDRIAGLSARMPFWTGVVFVAPGLWSIWFGVTVM